MKRVLFVVIVVLFQFIGNAQDKNNVEQKGIFKSGSVITSFNNEIIEYKFKSFDDLSKGIQEIAEDLDFNAVDNKKESCEITIEIKIEMDTGINTVVLSEKIKTNCSNETVAIVTKTLKIISIAAAI